MKPISELIWNPETAIMPATEDMSEDCHGGTGGGNVKPGCSSLATIWEDLGDVPLFSGNDC